MGPQEVVLGPKVLGVVALVVGAAGAGMFLLGNIIMRITGSTVEEHARRTSPYRGMGQSGQLRAGLSDLRNIPPLIGGMGLFSLVAGVLLGLGAAVWWLVLFLVG